MKGHVQFSMYLHTSAHTKSYFFVVFVKKQCASVLHHRSHSYEYFSDKYRKYQTAAEESVCICYLASQLQAKAESVTMRIVPDVGHGLDSNVAALG